MKEAILQRTGQVGKLLSIIDIIERGQWQELTNSSLPISESEFNSDYIESIQWTNNVISNLYSDVS
jgi:c-di-GMP-related signal transduction protein